MSRVAYPLGKRSPALDRSFDNYEKTIRSLPLVPTASDVLVSAFLMAREGRLEAFYAPLHGVTPDAQVVVVGLTPGLSQMVLAFQEARTLLAEGWQPPELFVEIRRRVAFAGPMRRNLVDMLDKIGLAERLGLATTAALFGDISERLHSTSVLRYPILKDQRNYSGSPKVRNSRMLTEIAKANLPSELVQLPNALIVPLGRAVEDALAHLGFHRSSRILRGFPHPSGGNGHRVRQFKSEYRSLRRAVHAW